jgi:hypothetical protein
VIVRADASARATFAAGAAAAAIALACVFGAVYVVKATLDRGRTASANSRLPYDDRELAGGNSLLVDKDAAHEARALIPVGERYRVVTGDHLSNATPLTKKFIETWMTYFLMPRRPDPKARWIICYGCDTSALGAPYTAHWRDENGISIGEAG